jgi:hypothetical protein
MIGILPDFSNLFTKNSSAVEVTAPTPALSLSSSNSLVATPLPSPVFKFNFNLPNFSSLLNSPSTPLQNWQQNGAVPVTSNKGSSPTVNEATLNKVKTSQGFQKMLSENKGKEFTGVVFIRDLNSEAGTTGEQAVLLKVDAAGNIVQSEAFKASSKPTAYTQGEMSNSEAGKDLLAKGKVKRPTVAEAQLDNVITYSASPTSNGRYNPQEAVKVDRDGKKGPGVGLDSTSPDIQIHKSYYGDQTSSLGCLTINDADFQRFQNTLKSFNSGKSNFSAVVIS